MDVTSRGARPRNTSLTRGAAEPTPSGRYARLLEGDEVPPDGQDPIGIPSDPANPFESFYRDADGDASTIPWARLSPNDFVTTWLEEHDDPPGQALVVACGLGDDAEALAGAGWSVAAFDIAPSAIRWCRERFPGTEVEYRVADLFDLPSEWAARFDLVVEVLTVQSLPPELQDQAMRVVAAQVAPGGHLIVYTIGRHSPHRGHGPPWPLARDELGAFTAAGLSEVSFTSRPSPWEGFEVFNVEYTRTTAED